jgi:type I restriction enzyme S subunit
MKDSGVEWIGEIPETWKNGQIGHLYTERKEKVSDREYEPLSVTMNGILPQLSTAAKTDAHDDRKLVRKGDFAINSRSDRRGSCGISSYDGSVSLINSILTPRNNMNPQYYNWLFHSSMFSDEFYKWGHGIVDDLWTTNWSDMKKITIPIPSLDEQRVIADYLDNKCILIDFIIEKTKASIEEYKKLKQAIITRAVTKGVQEDRPMKESGIEWLGKIPVDWNIEKTKTIAERIVVGVVIKPADYFDENGTIPFLRGINIKEYTINSEPMEYISEESNQMNSKSIIHTGDILIVRDGSIGVSCVVPEKYEGANVVSLIIVTCIGGVDPHYVTYSLNSTIGKTQFELMKIGSALTHTSVKSVSKIIHAIPSKEEQLEIVEFLDNKCAEIDELITKKETLCLGLEAYKKSMVYEYVTGKKEVPST